MDEIKEVPINHAAPTILSLYNKLKNWFLAKIPQSYRLPLIIIYSIVLILFLLRLFSSGPLLDDDYEYYDYEEFQQLAKNANTRKHEIRKHEHALSYSFDWLSSLFLTVFVSLLLNFCIRANRGARVIPR